MKRIRLLMFLLSLIVGGGSVWAQSWTGNEVQNGTFFLYNVGADKFLNNGDPSQGWGTNAYLQAGFGMDVTLAQVNEGVYSIETRIKNNDTQHYLNSNTWCDGSVTNWEFRAVAGETNTYQIISNGQYLMATEALNDVEMLGDPGSRVTSTYWKLVSLDDFKAAMRAKAYSATDPMDVSVFIQGRSFARNDQRNNTWVTTHNGGNWTFVGGTKQNKYYGNEAYNNTFDVHQSITGLPEGTYEVQCSGFGTNGTTYIYGNTTSKAIQSDNTTGRGTNMEAKWIAIHEDNAFAGQTTGTFAVGDGNLTVGIKREAVKSGDWCVYDEFRLYFYGLDLSGFEATLASAVEAAEAVEGTVPTAAWDALNAVITANNKSWTSVAEYTDATNAIIAATNTAKALQTPYANYKIAKPNVLAVKSQTTFTDEGGAAAAQMDVDVAAADEAVEAATTVESINAAIVQVRTAASTFAGSVAINKGQYIDLTDAMLFNAAMRETGGLSLWNIVSNTNASYPKYNGRCSEFWQANFEFNQTAPMMPAGNYNIEVYAFHRAGNYNTYLYANEDKIQVLPIANGENSMDGAANAFDQGLYLNSLKITLDEAQDVIIGFKNEDTETDKWTIFRDFKIKFFGDDALAVYREEYENKLAEAEEALEAGTYANVTGEERTALNTAITETYPKSVVETDETQEKFETATTGLDAAITTFKSAKSAYDNFVTVVANAASNKVDYEYASEEKLTAYQANLVAATSATDAATKAAAIVPSYRLYVESNALAEGVENAVDMTARIKQTALADWTEEITGSDAHFVLKSDEDTYTAGDGTKGTNLIDTGDLWGASSYTAKMSQDVTLTAGRYLLTAIARGSNDLTTFRLFADDNIVNMEHFGAAVGTGIFDRGFNDYSVEFTLDNTKSVKIGFEAATETEHNWASVARFRLVQLEDNADWADAADFTALTEATQPTAKLGFDEGDYAPYNNSDNIAAVQAELDKVQADMNNYGKALKATVTAAIEAIKALEWVANEGEVNAVYDGTFANAENDGAPAGWTMSNNTLGGSYHSRAFVGNDKLSEFNETNSALYIRFDGTNSDQGSMYYYGNTAGYTMPLKAATRYYVKADVKGWGSTGKPQRMNVTGPAGFSAVGETLTLANNGDTDDAAPQQFFIVFTTAEAGDYVINFQSPGGSSEHNAVVSNIELKKVPQLVLNDEDGCTEAVTYADVTVNRTVKGGNKWNSFTVPFDMDVPEGWTVKELTGTAENGEYLTLQFTETDAIEAGKPYMVKLAANAEDLTEISVAGVAINPTLNNIEVTGATMIGNFEPTTVPTGAFFISNNTWYEAAEAQPVNIKAFRAYIELSEEATARGIMGIFSDLEGDVTGINSVNATEKKFDGTVYDLSGRKVAQPARGLYIVNGKKVVIK